MLCHALWVRATESSNTSGCPQPCVSTSRNHRALELRVEKRVEPELPLCLVSAVFFFCQKLLEHSVLQAGLKMDDRIEDHAWAGPANSDRVVHAQYVDNFFVCGVDPAGSDCI